MNFAHCRFCIVLMVALLLCLFATATFAQDRLPASPNGTIPQANHLQNSTFECGVGGYYESVNSRNEAILLPNQWILAANGPVPYLNSGHIYFDRKKGGCTAQSTVERIEGEDSLYISSLDVETPPEPGKPFDVSIYQQVEAIAGEPYSLSGWMLSLCGGSFSKPNDCPTGYYMAKMLGIDPTGGVDPNAGSVVWVENRDNFITPDGARVGWTNLYVSALAQSNKITVFARINSPFRWHGNHAFIDALDLVFAPSSWLSVTPIAPASHTYQLAWDGGLGPDIPAINGGRYHLFYDVQYYHSANNEWRTLQQGADASGSMPFALRCAGTYQFRVRARAEQPEGGGGVWPNQRYPGVWSEPVQVTIEPSGDPPGPITGNQRIFMPMIINQATC